MVSSQRFVLSSTDTNVVVMQLTCKIRLKIIATLSLFELTSCLRNESKGNSAIATLQKQVCTNAALTHENLTAEKPTR